MITAHLFSLTSIDLDPDAVPEDPANCWVIMTARIGPVGGVSADSFEFTVVTPRYLADHGEVRWGRGLLLVGEFSWPVVDRMVRRLVARSSAATWEEVAGKLNHELLWEFENYTPFDRAARAV